MSAEEHLIVLRGNSGSGKTTLARRLQHALGRGTANVGQDHLRRIILREHDVPGGDNIAFIEHTARYCLGLGYHVIVEGILYSPHYGDMLRRLIEGHDGPTHVFYLDIPLAETLRRHEGRPMRAEVEPAKLVEWYHERDLLGLRGERLIGPELDEDATLALLLDAVGPVAPRPELDGARFL